MAYDIGQTVEVVENPMYVEHLGSAPVWVQTQIEAPSSSFPDRIFVRINGLLVTRSPKYVREVR